MIIDVLQLAAQRIEMRDAEILLQFVLGKSRAFLYTWPQHVLTDIEHTRFEALVDRAEAGEPIAYLVGQKEFWSLPLAVNPAVLIPRADTETLVETVLAQLPAEAPHQVMDLGTGSGAIALALASMRPHWHITAVDISPAALDVARRNASQHSLNNIDFVQSDWFADLPRRHFDAIVSNPPYIAAEDPVLQRLRYEPMLAFVSGTQGFDSLAHVIANAGQYVVSDGYLFLEHGAMQEKTVAAYMQQQGWEKVTLGYDLAGLPRVTWGQWGF